MNQQMKHRWRDVPAVWRSTTYQWWVKQYCRHIDAGFSDADARLMVSHLSRQQHDPNRRKVALQQERI